MTQLGLRKNNRNNDVRISGVIENLNFLAETLSTHA